ncbi:hypothetical protein DXG01_009118 [Tephrocybe rancida]|nr:hypothetical protein DXG01_009118 [Tephrocybe rancida]
MVQIAPLLFAGLIAWSVSTPFKRTVAQVEADIARISTQATAFDNAIELFASSGIASLMDALSSALNLTSQFNTATTDVAILEAFEPTIIDALTNIINKKAAFQELAIARIPALVLSGLRTLNTSSAAACDAFERGLTGATLADLVTEARQTQSIGTAAFNEAIAAYT